MLLSDDGAFVHAFTSPKRKVPKVYLATLKHPLDDAQLAKLRDGVLLHGETAPSAALAAERCDDRLLELTVLEGKYHQVKRMVAAAGNRVEKLHRACIGGYVLPDTCRRRVALARRGRSRPSAVKISASSARPR